jgi:hypothetical protein
MKPALSRIMIIATGLLLAVPAFAHASGISAPPLPKGAPELDPSALVSGMAFLGAGVMLLVERYRKRNK